MNIHIDLNDLTQEKLGLALSKIGTSVCSYTQPCIIGTLMSEDQRDYIAERNLNFCSILTLIDDNYASIASEDQFTDAKLLQEYFDTNQPKMMIEVAQKYIKKD